MLKYHMVTTTAPPSPRSVGICNRPLSHTATSLLSTVRRGRTQIKSFDPTSSGSLRLRQTGESQEHQENCWKPNWKWDQDHNHQFFMKKIGSMLTPTEGADLHEWFLTSTTQPLMSYNGSRIIRGCTAREKTGPLKESGTLCIAASCLLLLSP